MSTTTTTNPKAEAIDRYYRKKWFAVVRLVCYLWAIAMLALVIHYEPETKWYIEPAIRTLYLAVGGCLGANRKLLKPIKSYTKKGENK